MPLAAGARLGPYEIIAPIGAGGMGEVYRARDTRLNRDVAIKCSVERFSERFEREARAIAALNHPNVCHLYDVGPNYLVMELVEGPTLAERIKEGPIPLHEAVIFARQIIDALEAAHEKGITHRDLKPANIKINLDGVIKVLDFGLAKMSGSGATSPENSPTLSMAATQAGVVLGTAAYMSPEQARGKFVDARSDIWAFGVVFYEMITGLRLFKGEDLTEIVASVVKDQIDLSAVPQGAGKLLRACLQRDLKKRLRAIEDARFLLDEQPIRPLEVKRHRLGWVATAIAVLGCAVLAFVHLRATGAPERVVQLSVPLPENMNPGFLELSPDGRRLLLVLATATQTQIYLRPLDSGELQPLSGTSGARTPFWSPDSRFIGFFADQKLKVIPAAGGPAQVLCGEAGLGTGGSWSRNGVILFGGNGGLHRVDANGGQCTTLGKYDPNISATFPTFLPDGIHFFYIRGIISSEASRGLYVATLTEPMGRKVLADISSVVYMQSHNTGRSNLLFLREGRLLAQPIDQATLVPVGDPFSVGTRVSFSLTTPQMAASVSADGTLAYLSGRSRESQLTWFDRSGKELGRVGAEGILKGVMLSPDGNWVSVTREDPNSQSAWLFDLVHASESRLFSGTVGLGTLWSPDNTRVWFVMSGPEGPGIYQRHLKTGTEESIEKRNIANLRIPSDWSRDGRFLVYTENDPKTHADIWYVPLASGRPSGEAVRLVGTPANESQGQLSPDGKWLAYFSDATGRGEVYVRQFPEGSAVWRISVNGGDQPRWRSDGKELYFRYAATQGRAGLMAVSLEPGTHGGLRVGSPERLFETRVLPFVREFNLWNYSPAADGKRFLVNVLTQTGAPTIDVITNWRNMLEKAGQH